MVPAGRSSPIFSAIRNRPMGVFILPSSLPTPKREVETLEVLERRSFPAASVKLLASDRSAGKKLPFRGQLIEVETLGETSFVDRDLAFFKKTRGRDQQMMF